MNRTARNLLIFSLVIIASGWLYQIVNVIFPGPTPEENLGLLLWLLTPLATVLLLRWLGGDRWGDFGGRLHLKGNWGWYALSLLIYPLTIAVTLSLGALTGQVSLEGLEAKGLSALLAVMGMGVAAAAIKNIFEEFAWRGYLTPRFKALGLSNLSNHLLTGLIWGLWHIPYWLFFLGQDAISSVTSVGAGWFIVLAFIGIFPTALVLGELRLKTDSLWPAWLAHNVTNVLSAQLVTEGFIRLTNPAAEILFEPGGGGVVMMVLFTLVGIWMLSNKRQDKN